MQFDVELLEKNALTYNDPKSGIALFAKHLTRIYKASVASTFKGIISSNYPTRSFTHIDLFSLSTLDPSKVLPTEIHVKTTRRHEDDEFDGSGSENDQLDVDSEPELDPILEAEAIRDNDAEDDFLV